MDNNTALVIVFACFCGLIAGIAWMVIRGIK